MGRSIDQLRWQHALANHLADRGVPAVRSRGLVERDGLWYELFDVAEGDDVYAGVDTWEPFRSREHVTAAGRELARLHQAGERLRPAGPQPQRGFVVQIDLVRLTPVRRSNSCCDRGRRWPTICATRTGEAAVEAGLRRAVRPAAAGLPALPRRPLHGDWQTNNLFFAATRLSGIIDFHQADHGPGCSTWRWRSSATASSGTASRTGDDRRTTSTTPRALIEAYHAAVAAGGG